MQELRTALHLYSHYTGGTASHAGLLARACEADLDVIITTDQNLLVSEIDSYTHNRQTKPVCC